MTSSWKLKPHPVLPRGKPLLVCILDGWAEGIEDEFNAIHVAKTPTMDALKATAPERWRLLKAHGSAVGLPSDSDMGNSEVGHNALGAGKIYKQGAGLVDHALSSGKLFQSPSFAYVKEAFSASPNRTLHLIGLLSDGGVHSRFDHLVKLMHGCASHGAKRIRVHVLTDGRDVADGTSFQFVEALEKELAQLAKKGGCDARIASGGGRMNVTMDRYENDWRIVERGWRAHILGDAPHKFSSALEALKVLKEADPSKCNDQYYPPWVIVDKEGQPIGRVGDGDAVITFNFRADRMVMLSKALEYDKFTHFDRTRFPKIRFAGMTQYDTELKLPRHFLVTPPEIQGTSGEWLVRNGVRTFACSETVKFGHVTFYWNGNRSGKFDEKLETYKEIPTDLDIQFNEKPRMKADEIAAAASNAILSHKYDQVRINFPNGDMVGHTGDLKATILACEAVDQGIKVCLGAVDQAGGIFLITCDHGNAEDMVKRDPKTGKPVRDASGKLQPLTSHTLAPVPIAIGGPGLHPGVRFRNDLPAAGLANVAATIINLLGFEAPSDMEPTLIEVRPP
ncbi:hypothetical protein CBR_g36655 [Chara braunii]|uniref:phosphoglycerate mutase (2,3-diphosphoglycerate-independent) n=1 Tax=Chara braunii TaxID=69332 RepID=A0A388LL68_CHABU|nr:hypothetical protein CBR_g36655 [Chara braunii]|eukprot:GBG83037.1 hypothetical protein CBR_g36655 [Chara braunii]